ncbi:MAG: hypothetical protein A3A98_00150 [Candidatus Staskawiczbacteria bacterium RIFCSPLOWO2_01_FULL_40_39]|uniref:RNA polymerase sigma-70 domain-containing protein n=1 Tax=Candidatus Staskawiczbacteria bacterium RIFCSPHIGHO2_01_FULL_39_25 TaxID=1802202 RepID=A0A1G2HMI0_9BACT|nr:MAG: hypothetical protein A2730_00150 [Candidatus Staskawiczbacteria bacterium RIFCSPHIGHO2_01_FULL_39_25]OGZ73153.1 MAG: hypothetical protein A3A98_00150 [Candidatus Staskawiczbacteria bacterium RIFCSPLOWO2_01_FULL_40_39]OGZ76510.1 MAG: hypothetical protein A3I87_01140 [Candidatus Staskawiczbacteria bacterium RIFCSPLOWO2_02_FULL_39_8]
MTMAAKVKNSLDFYLEKISETPLLTPDEERVLAEKIAEGRKAKDKLAMANLRLVASIAKKYAGWSSNFTLEDLVQEGNVGLLKAIEKFDLAQGCKFCTYATYWIKESIFEALIYKGKMIRTPSYMVCKVAKYNKAKSLLRTKLGRDPSENELQRRLGWNLENIHKVKECSERDALPTAPLSEEIGSIPLYEEDPLSAITAAEDLEILEKILQKCSLQEQTILSMRFGLKGAESQSSFKKIGEHLGISRERVRRIQEETFEKIRECG